MKNSRSETFLAINLLEMSSNGQINSKHLESLLKHFKVIVDKELNVKVYFNHIDKSKVRDYINRTIENGENNNLLLKNTELH